MTPRKPLAPRARALFYLQAFSRLLLVWAPASVGVAALVAANGGLLWGVLGGSALFFVMFLLAVWYPSLAFDRWGYSIDDNEVIISRGVFVHRVTAVPLGRIQHVDTRQGLIEQWMGLARLQLFTASGIGGDGVIPGLELEEAEAMRDRLVQIGGADDGV